MSLLTRRRAALVALEGVSGTDALVSLTESARKAYAVLALEISSNTDRERISQPAAGGTLSPQLDVVGVGTSQVSFGLQLRGSGSSSRDPEWVRVAQACGYQKHTGTLLAAESIRYFTTTPTTAAGGRFIRGEQIYGKNTLASATWDSVVDSGNGLGTTPSVGDDFVAFGDVDSEDAPTCSGKIVAISGTAITLRVTSGAGRVKSGDFIRANAASGGALRGYMDVTDDQPVMFVCDESHNHVANTASLWGWVAQGSFGNSMICVGQHNGVLTTLAASSAVTATGGVLRPDSESTVTFDVGSWSGATPVAGDEIIKQNAPGRWLAAGQILAVDGSTLTVRVYYGSFATGDIVYQSVTASSATVATDQAAGRGPSVTVWDSIDGFLRSFTGVRGTFSIELAAGQPGTIKFDMQGVPYSQAMQEPLTDLSFVNTIAPRWESGVADYLGIPLRTVGAKLTQGNDVQRSSDANATGGTLDYRLAGREPQLEFTVHRPGVTGWQIDNAIANATWRPAGFRVGSATNNIVSLVIPRMQLISARDGDDNGILTAVVTARCIGIAGDDEVLIHWR